MKNQSTNHLFMIEPEVFFSNEQTLESNHYQHENDKTMHVDDIKKKALIEFHALKEQIEKNGISVTSKVINQFGKIWSGHSEIPFIEVT